MMNDPQSLLETRAEHIPLKGEALGFSVEVEWRIEPSFFFLLGSDIPW